MWASRVDPMDDVDARIRALIARMTDCEVSAAGLASMKRMLSELDDLFSRRHRVPCRYCNGR